MAQAQKDNEARQEEIAKEEAAQRQKELEALGMVRAPTGQYPPTTPPTATESQSEYR